MRFLLKIMTPIVILLLVVISLLLLNERKEFDIRGLAQINPIPHTKELIAKQKYSDANEYLSYFMQFDYIKSNPQAQELQNIIQTKRDSYEYKKDKVIDGILHGKSDENIGKISAIASDFLVIGDIRDLFIQGNNYINDEKVDKVILALSSLGLLATATTIYSMGATAPAKDGISVLKYGKRVNKIPNWLSKSIVREAKVSKETKSLKNVQKILEPIYTLYQKVGLKDTLNLLKETKSLKELNGFVKLSKRFGKNSSGLIKTVGIKSVKTIDSMKNIKPKTVLYASSYGEKGLIGLKRLGEAKFLKRVKVLSRVSKTTYKGNFDTLFAKLLQIVPTSVLYAIVFGGLFYFMYKFFFLAKRVYPFNDKIKAI
ncbi:MAG TPA: hypothetical protein ENK88_04560 [Campylobacterales bacterium]|nr:hypothetical protein [Campylobacterales bacterium]